MAWIEKQTNARGVNIFNTRIPEKENKTKAVKR
jgi:hypothetical protein